MKQKFWYSKKQLECLSEMEMNFSHHPAYVKINGEWKEYTKCGETCNWPDAVLLGEIDTGKSELENIKIRDKVPRE